MSAQPPASPSANVTPPTPVPKDDANVGIHSRPLTASSGGPDIAGTVQAAEPSGPSRLAFPVAGVVSSIPHGELTRPPRTPPGPDNPFKSPEGSQISHHGLHQFDSQSRVSHKVGLSANQGNGASSLPHHDGDSRPLPPPPQPGRLTDRPPVGRQWTGGTRTSNRRSVLDYIVPVSEEGDVHEKVSLSPHLLFNSLVTS